MKAVILAAGQGTRLRPLTNDKPKCMVEYKETPIISHICRSMKSCGLSDVILVTGFMKEKLDYLGLKTYFNENYERTNMVSSWFCAESEFNDDLIVSYSDIVYRPEVLQALIEDRSDFAVVVDKDWRTQWEARMENPLEDAETMKIDSSGNIYELGKKASSYDEIEGQYMGLFKISKTALGGVIDFYHSLDRNADYDGKDFDNMYMTSFIQLIIDQLMPVKAVFINGGWLEIDCIEDLSYDLELEGN